MGWFYTDVEGHEGYVIGLRRGEGLARNCLYRELGYPEDDKETAVHAVQAGCDCGWRSPRFQITARWFPFVVDTDEDTEATLKDLWEAHIHNDVRRWWKWNQTDPQQFGKSSK